MISLLSFKKTIPYTFFLVCILTSLAESYIGYKPNNILIVFICNFLLSLITAYVICSSILKDNESSSKQRRTWDWLEEAWPQVAEDPNLPQRAYRLYEAVIESFQAAGLNLDETKLATIRKHVYDNPPGHINQEIGSLLLCVYCFAESVNVCAEDEFEKELARVWKKINTIREKNKQKLAAEMCNPYSSKEEASDP